MFKIRSMVKCDYQDVFSLWKTIENFRIREIDDSEEYFCKFLDKNPGLSVVAVVNGIIVGTALVGYDGRTAKIYHFAVNENYRDNGIGHAMLNQLLRNLDDAGACQVELMCFQENPANKFWSNFGFIGDQSNHYTMTIKFQNYKIIK